MSTDRTDIDLQPLRERIDDLDRKIIELLNERAQIVVEVGRVKRDTQSPIYRPERERQIIEQVRKWNNGPLPNKTIESIWREMMSGSFALERPLRIGYLGPAGTFSHMAARIKFGASVEYDNLPDITAVFDEVSRGHIDYGLVPIENSTEGGVTDSLDSFLHYDVQVCAEVLISIHQNLLSNSLLNGIKVIYSHPQGLAQCRSWLSAQLPNIERVAVASTSKAAEMAAKEEGAAAIASALSGEIYDLKMQFTNIEDNPNNTTRFYIVGKQQPEPTGDDKTAILFTTEHKSGALSSVLDVFSANKLNMTHIDKRPSKRENWEYYFFVDLLGHHAEQHVTKALAEARKHCLHLRVLGSFPRATEVL